MMYYEALYKIIFILLVNLLHTVLLKKVMDLFLLVKYKNQKADRFVFAAYYLGTAVMYSLFPATVLYGLCNLAGIMGVTYLYRAAWEKKLWISLAFFSMDMGCQTAVVFVFDSVGKLQQFAAQMLLLLVCVTVISRIPDREEAKETVLEKKQMISLIMLPVVSIAAFVAMMYGNIRGSMAGFLCVVMILFHLCVFYLYQMLLQYYVQLRERDMYKQQTFAYQNQIEVIMESQSRVRALKHDMKNHVLTLQALARGEQFEELLEYLASMQEFMVNPAENVFTGNEALDSLLNYQLQRARNSLKQVQTRFVIPEKLTLHSFDLNVIFGNLLDNAIAAAVQTEEQLLNLSIRMEKGILFLRIVNSCSGISDGVCDIRKMAEKSAEGHGIGLANVRRIVEKYHGEMEMSCEANRMETDIMLYLKKL